MNRLIIFLLLLAVLPGVHGWEQSQNGTQISYVLKDDLSDYTPKCGGNVTCKLTYCFSFNDTITLNTGNVIHKFWGRYMDEYDIPYYVQSNKSGSWVNFTGGSEFTTQAGKEYCIRVNGYKPILKNIDVIPELPDKLGTRFQLFELAWWNSTCEQRYNYSQGRSNMPFYINGTYGFNGTQIITKTKYNDDGTHQNMFVYDCPDTPRVGNETDDIWPAHNIDNLGQLWNESGVYTIINSDNEEHHFNWYHMEDDTDSGRKSGNCSNTGVAYGSGGLFGDMSQFDGVNDILNCGDSWNLGTNWSIGLYYKVDEIGANSQVIASSKGVGLEDEYHFKANGDVQYYGSGTCAGTFTPTVGRWTCQVITFHDVAPQHYDLYTNDSGSVVLEETVNCAFNEEWDETVYIGNVQGGGEEFQGYMDNMFAISYALNSTEVEDFCYSGINNLSNFTGFQENISTPPVTTAAPTNATATGITSFGSVTDFFLQMVLYLLIILIVWYLSTKLPFYVIFIIIISIDVLLIAILVDEATSITNSTAYYIEFLIFTLSAMLFYFMFRESDKKKRKRKKRR